MNKEYGILVQKTSKRENLLKKDGRLYPVGVGIVDTGIYPHRDLREKIVDFYDCIGGKTGLYDNNGHGSHIAGIIGGNGAASNGRYRGISEGARFVVIKGLDEKGGGLVRQVCAGIEYLIKNREKLNIRLINISMGGGSEEEYDKYRPLLAAVEEAWNRGITVCVAAGNSGPLKGSVTIPGTSRKVITVGASDDHIPVRMGNRVILNYSGKGPTRECIVKPDVLCPGADIISCKNNLSGYVSKSGTSMSTAVMTGLIAHMLSEHQDMTPKEIKQIITDRGIQIIGKNI